MPSGRRSFPRRTGRRGRIIADLGPGRRAAGLAYSRPMPGDGPRRSPPIGAAPSQDPPTMPRVGRARLGWTMSLVLENLTKRFGPTVALDGVSFEAPAGRIFGFLGANGAGKTTAMRIILDILRPDAGRVTWRGIPTETLPRNTWGYLPEERGLYPRMRVLDQLVFIGVLFGLSRREAADRARGWLARFRIADSADRRAEELSKGNQQKVQVIAAILHDPEILLLDEPFSGLDPVNANLLKEALLELNARGRTIVFSTHQMDQVEELCHAIAIIDRGRLVLAGPLAEVKRSTGKRVVRIGASEGRLDWLAELDGVRVTRVGQDYTEAEVAAGRDPAIVLAEALRRGTYVTRFEIGDPSIEQIFIERVGRAPAEEEGRLAPAATPEVLG